MLVARCSGADLDDGTCRMRRPTAPLPGTTMGLQRLGPQVPGLAEGCRVAGRNDTESRALPARSATTDRPRHGRPPG
jgi:hypothetical protein